MFRPSGSILVILECLLSTMGNFPSVIGTYLAGGEKDIRTTAPCNAGGDVFMIVKRSVRDIGPADIPDVY